MTCTAGSFHKNPYQQLRPAARRNFTLPSNPPRFSIDSVSDELSKLTRDGKRTPEVDLSALARALADGRRSARYFLDLETGSVIRAFHQDDDDPASQAVRDSLEYDPRYEPVPTLAATSLNGCRGAAREMWLKAEALDWLADVERARDVRFRAIGL